MNFKTYIESLETRISECEKELETDISLEKALSLRDEWNSKKIRANYARHTLKLIPQKHSEFISQMEFDEKRDYFNGKKNIYMAGNFGTGKTTLAYLICAIERIKTRASFGLLRWGDFFSFDDKAAENIRKAYDSDVLIIDDFASDDVASEKMDNISRMKINELIDARYSAAQKTIFTTNATPENAKARVSPQTIDRIFESCEFLKMTGESFRRKK